MFTLYAIPNCDTVKKARVFLENNSIQYDFVDFKKNPPTDEQINKWKIFLSELPVNKKGLTYRKYKEEFESYTEVEKIKFIKNQVSIIKRPILERNGKVLCVGFDEKKYIELVLDK